MCAMYSSLSLNNLIANLKVGILSKFPQKLSFNNKRTEEGKVALKIVIFIRYFRTVQHLQALWMLNKCSLNLAVWCCCRAHARTQYSLQSYNNTLWLFSGFVLWNSLEIFVTHAWTIKYAWITAHAIYISVLYACFITAHTHTHTNDCFCFVYNWISASN